MRIMASSIAAVGLVLLAGCGERPVEDDVTRAYDRQAASIEQRADELEARARELKAQAETIGKQASELNRQADRIRKTGQELSRQVREGVITRRQAMPAGAAAAAPASRAAP